MFAIAGAVFMFKLGPLQRTMQKHAADGAASGTFDLRPINGCRANGTSGARLRRSRRSSGSR